MRLVPGTRLGAHDIVAGIGRGGMGEVYRATDGLARGAARLLAGFFDVAVSG